MARLKLLGVFVIFAFSLLLWRTGYGAEPLKTKLRVRLEEGHVISAAGGKVPVELQFQNHIPDEQKFSNAEYRFAILNDRGEQVEDALLMELPAKEIILKGRSTVDNPGVSVQAGKLVAGKEYYFVAALRNLAGHVKFTAAGGKPVAAYRAELKAEKITVYAKGKNPTSGWKNELTVLPIDVYPPEFQFKQIKPTGIVAQVITPFEVSVTAAAPDAIESVLVSDANGKHQVPVTPGK